MRSTVTKLVVLAAGIAFLVATQADAAKRKAKPRSKPVAERGWIDRSVRSYHPNTVTFSNNILGADPDPHIRHQLLRDLSGFFGGDI